MNIRVAITDDHPMVVQGLGTMLAAYDHISVTGNYYNGAQLLEGLMDNCPDVLLLDMQLPDKTGDELIPIIKPLYPDLKILVLTNFESTLYATKSIWQGAQGYLLKTADASVLIKAIGIIYEGGQFVEPSIKEHLDGFARSKKLYATKSVLTTREKEVLQLIVNGQTDTEIASALFLSLHTIKHYRMSILLKMDVKNTAAMVSKALKSGLAS
jgi:DNA-binding NarL/FixJ family response regulator